MQIENFYIGQDYLTINFISGTHQVVRWEGPVDEPLDEVLFVGHYDDCLNFVDRYRQEWNPWN